LAETCRGDKNKIKYIVLFDCDQKLFCCLLGHKSFRISALNSIFLLSFYESGVERNFKMVSVNMCTVKLCYPLIYQLHMYSESPCNNIFVSFYYTIKLLQDYKYRLLPYILESNPHPSYSFKGPKNQMRIRIACGLDSRSRA